VSDIDELRAALIDESWRMPLRWGVAIAQGEDPVLRIAFTPDALIGLLRDVGFARPGLYIEEVAYESHDRPVRSMYRGLAGFERGQGMTVRLTARTHTGCEVTLDGAIAAVADTLFRLAPMTLDGVRAARTKRGWQ